MQVSGREEAKRARESLDLWGVALRIMKPGSCGYASMQYRRVPQDLCENQKSFAGWLLLVKTAVIRLFFWLWIPRMKNWWAVLGIFHAKMPRFSWESYQKIAGQISILVNGFCIKFKTVLDYTVTVQFKIYAGVLKKEFFHKKSCRKDDIVC